MAETIKTYLLSDPETMIPMGRDEFYAEQIKEFKKNGKPTRAVDVIQIFIFNNAGELLVQKRSFDKAHNPGLLDKSVGGHVRYDDEYDYTVMVETVQELQTPSIVLKSDKDFEKTHNLLNGYLTTIALIKHAESEIVISKKIIDGKPTAIADRMHIYFGVYDGRVKPIDKEAKGILWYSLDDLTREMKELPQTYADSMHVLIKRCKSDMEKFLKTIIKS